MSHRRNQRGFSLVETLVAVAMALFAVMAAVVYMQTASRGTRQNTDKSFAVQKAMSMLEELKAVVETTTGEAASMLDDKDDGSQRDHVALLIDPAGARFPREPGCTMSVPS